MAVGPGAGGFVDADDLRAEFCTALSKMYRAEVPLYGKLVQLVDEVNVSAQDGESWQVADRLKVERHGAIRLGLASELHMIARLFRLMGMHPVGYYDLSGAGVPVHATAFRPVSPASLARNPFRVFTSLLRPELILDRALRDEVLAVLARRDIFHPTTRALVAQAEQRGGLTRPEADLLVKHALETFKWHEDALVPAETYARMRAEHPLLADIAGFRGPHINHLTPRVLDIDAAQAGMPARGICPKAIIEGPPRRHCAILLRQTSFQALTEPIRFPGGEGGPSEGSHRARFGEIESRGCALTRKGYDLYLSLMAEAQRTAPPFETNTAHQARLEEIFASFPDTWSALRENGLAYFRYTLVDPSGSAVSASSTACPGVSAPHAIPTFTSTSTSASASTSTSTFTPASTSTFIPASPFTFTSTSTSRHAPPPAPDDTEPRADSTPTLDELLRSGQVQATPIVYEDFLPASAAGIFRSNLNDESARDPASKDASNTGSMNKDVVGKDGDAVGRDGHAATDAATQTTQRQFERALGGRVADFWELYEAMERDSLRAVEAAMVPHHSRSVH